MESYPVDIDPSQVVRWVKSEQERSPSTFRISARRSREVREIPARSELHLGDEEREDLTEIATIGILEIAPARTADGWRLRVIVEDEIGPRISEGEMASVMASVAEQQIDLGAFYHQFIRPGRGKYEYHALPDARFWPVFFDPLAGAAVFDLVAGAAVPAWAFVRAACDA
jgi:hypothetical protein